MHETSSKPLSLVHLFIIGLFFSAAPAFGFNAGASTIQTVVSWLQGIGVGICTIAIMWSAFKVMFQGARINDVAPIFIGGILFGSAAIIAGMLISGN